MKLWEYVRDNANRGSCRCGHCFDAPSEDQQPFGHTVDLIFFEVSKTEDANVDTFRSLVEAEYPHWLDGQEHNYIEIGADIGDQGLGMTAMGLGAIFGIWVLMTPRSMGFPEEMALQMAGSGMVSIQAKEVA